MEGTSGPSDEPSTSTPAQEDHYPPAKMPRKDGRSAQSMRLPILRPKFPAKHSGAAVRLITSPPPITSTASNPRPLISLLDSTEFKDRSRYFVPPVKPKKPYYTELDEIRKEFGVPDTFDAEKTSTMSATALAEKLRLLQRLRGENNFLRDSIQKKTEQSEARTAAIEQFQRTTAETLNHCQLLRETIADVEADTERIRNRLR